MSDEAVANFIDRSQQTVGTPPSDRDAPKVPFQTALKLTGDQEKRMLDHAFKRMMDLSNEAGRDQTLQPTWWSNLQPTPNQAIAAQGFLQASTFLGKRSRFDATFENDFSWRPWTMGVDNIFMSSNIPVPLTRRICRQMIAKAKDNFLGSDPWFTVEPTPGTLTQIDDEVAERIQRFTQFKLRESHTKDNHARAIQRALILGECAVKTSYVVRDQIFNCYGPGTEVLTDKGWILIEEWSSGKVATMNLRSGALEYQEPLRKVAKKFDGEMVRIKTRSQELFVTPNHRMVVRERRKLNGKTSLYRCVKPADSLNVFDMLVTHVDKWDGSSEPLILPAIGNIPERIVDRKLAARALGWFVTEGCAFVRNGRKTPTTVVCLTQNPGKKQDIMLRDFEAAGWKLGRSSHRQFRTFDRQAHAFFSECGKWAINKKVPKWLKESSTEVLNGFIETAVLGDGHKRPSGYRMICTISKQLADDYAEIAVKIGIRPKIHKYPAKQYKIEGRAGTNTQPQYWVGLCTAEGISLRDEKNNPRFFREKYSGYVHCLTVPNGTLVVRYNGGVMICGNTEATVLMNVDGQPLRAADGNHITSDDQWEEQDDGTGNKTQVLSRDKVTPHPEAPIWQNMPLNRRQVLFEGAKSEPIYFKDFLCPLTAESVQEADTVIHIYDKNVMEFVDLVVKRGMVDNSDESRIATAQKMVTLVQALSDNDSQPKSAEDMAIRPNENFTPVPSSADGGAGPIAEFAEFYMWYDANDDGIAENIMLIADRKNRVPIFYDHVANVTTDGLRPIEVIRINPIEGRWYGMGIMELFESYQTITDLLVNRWNFSQSRSGRVDFWNPTNTQEGDRNPNLQMNWGGTYTKKPGMKAEDCLETVYLNDTKFEALHEMVQFFMQLAMNESGVANANDGRAAGMDSSELATGILEVQKSGEELFQPIIFDLKGPLERLLNREIDVTLANLNPEEVYTYLDGDTMQLDKITPQDVRGLKYKATITLTTHKNQQTLAAGAQAAALVEKFYMLAPAVQAKVVSFYRDQVRALDPKVNVESVIVPLVDTPPPQAPAEEFKPSMSIAVKWAELPGEVQQQILAKMSVEESAAMLAAGAQANAAQEAAKKAKPEAKGSSEKLGEAPGSKTQIAAQLGQKNSQPKGVSANPADR